MYREVSPLQSVLVAKIISVENLERSGCKVWRQTLISDFFPSAKCTWPYRWKEGQSSVLGVTKIVRKRPRAMVQSFVDDLFPVLSEGILKSRHSN